MSLGSGLAASVSKRRGASLLPNEMAAAAAALGAPRGGGEAKAHASALAPPAPSVPS
tara:strand:- start:1007 stop:1177 length:171 start_codon:yes stop_codon:yes gene_type:complete